MAKNQIGKMTGIRHMARNKTCLVWWIPNNFSHTKYNGVTANPTVMNCTPPINQHMHTLTHVKIHLIIPFTPFMSLISYHLHTTHLIIPFTTFIPSHTNHVIILFTPFIPSHPLISSYYLPHHTIHFKYKKSRSDAFICFLHTSKGLRHLLGLIFETKGFW